MLIHSIIKIKEWHLLKSSPILPEKSWEAIKLIVADKNLKFIIDSQYCQIFSLKHFLLFQENIFQIPNDELL